jgi:hypothetical protein
MKKIQYITLLLCLIVGFSCAVDESCRTNRSVLMQFGLHHVNLTDTSRTVAAMTIDSLTVRGLVVDTLTGNYLNQSLDSVYKNLKLINIINVPLHKFERMSVYEITFNDKIITGNKDTLKFINKKDTLTILHENFDKYLSLECGSIKVHSIDTAYTTHHFIDSIRIINHKVNNINLENIQIYK